MKLAITSGGDSLDAEVDPRFGRCRYILFVDQDTLQFKAVENTGATGGGAGIATGQVIARERAGVLLTGNCGPNAYQVLSSAGIQVITDVSGKVKEVVQAYKEGQYMASTGPNVTPHAGKR